MVPFQAFGLKEDTGWFRLSVGAVSVEEIQEALPRVEAVLRAVAGRGLSRAGPEPRGPGAMPGIAGPRHGDCGGTSPMLKRFVEVREEEAGAVLWSFLYFFTLMCGYFILKPLRDAMGTAGGVKGLKWLWMFTATFAVMMVAVPAYSALVARWPRKRVIPLRLPLLPAQPAGLLRAVQAGVDAGERWRAPSTSGSASTTSSSSPSSGASWRTCSAASRAGASSASSRAVGRRASSLGLLLARNLAVPLGHFNLMLITVVLLEVQRALRAAAGALGP